MDGKDTIPNVLRDPNRHRWTALFNRLLYLLRVVVEGSCPKEQVAELRDSEDIVLNVPNVLYSTTCLNKLPVLLHHRAEGGCPEERAPAMMPMLGDTNPFRGVATLPLLDPKGKQSEEAVVLPTGLMVSPMQNSLESPLKGCPEGPPESPLLSPSAAPPASSTPHGPVHGGGAGEAALGCSDLPRAAARRHLLPGTA